MKVNSVVKLFLAVFILLMPFADIAAQEKKLLLPEITARFSPGMGTSCHRATVGLRINRKNTVGLMAGFGNTYIDANPSTIKAVQFCAFERYYMYPGERGIIAFYCDAFLGFDKVFYISGKYVGWDPREEVVSDNEGDIRFYAALEPGIRLRLLRNLHVFLGPSVAVNGIGLHFGVGL